MRRVGQHVRSTYSGVTPIIWDDMLRRWPPAAIEESGLGDVVEPMVSRYNSSDNFKLYLPPYFVCETGIGFKHNSTGPPKQNFEEGGVACGRVPRFIILRMIYTTASAKIAKKPKILFLELCCLA